MTSVLDSKTDHTSANLQHTLAACLELRLKDPSLTNTNAMRLFNGFYEGFPHLTVDQFAETLVISDHDRSGSAQQARHEAVARFYTDALPGLSSVLLKQRHAESPDQRKGELLVGEQASSSIKENGISYALDLQRNQDSSFYPDTRNLRIWLSEKMQGARVLNCFAYTGALGIAALAGSGREVWQTDLNPNFLALAQQSLALNHFPGEMKLLAQDFYPMAASFKGKSELFDCVILDAPLFSRTRHGKVDLLQNWQNLVNKVRPLVGHEGWLVVINNALFLKGSELMETVNQLTADGYLEVTDLIAVPEDVTGYTQSVVSKAPADPAPFNHPTKIIVMRAYRKDGRRA